MMYFSNLKRSKRVCLYSSATALFLMGMVACSSEPVVQPQPDWVMVADNAEIGAKDVLLLTQSMVGKWIANDVLSDDPLQIFNDAVKKFRPRKRGPVSRDDAGRPTMRGIRRGIGGLSRDGRPQNGLNDPRLGALFASEVNINLTDEKLIYHFARFKYPEALKKRLSKEGNGKRPQVLSSPYKSFNQDNKPRQEHSMPLAYPIDGSAVSNDGNINITFAEWEQQQFVIERNGPRGRIVEYWTLAPDASQLHLSMQINFTMLPDTLTINRVFESAPVSGDRQ